MKVKKQKKGISLIVLVITIIVMIILVSAIIISLSNNGIIDKASEAVDKTNEKQVEELANLAWADAYAENVGKSNEELLQALKTSVEKALSNNNVNKEDYGIEVTTTGVTIVKGWLQKSDKTVVKGSTTLEIGDYVNYHDTANEDKTEKYTGGWKVLGAENGKIKILSTGYVLEMLSYYGVQGLKSDSYDYLKIVGDLNEKSAPYGTGYGAIGARCITIEDIDSVTGYNKSNYNKGQINEYGNEVTYYWDNDTTNATKPYYEYTNKETGELVTGNLTSEHTYFNYLLGNEIKENKQPTSITSKQKITSITSNFYKYNFTDLLDISDAKDNKVYNLLSAPTSAWRGYFLDSTYVNTDIDYVSWGVYIASEDSIDDRQMIVTNNAFGTSSGGSILISNLRVVVELKSNVVLTGSSETGWSIQ